jgi:hypothetical protein
MRQWELYGITDTEQVEARTPPPDHPPVVLDASRSASHDRPTIPDHRFPIVLWTTDRLLQFTSSPKPAVRDLGLATDAGASGLLDLCGPSQLSIDVIDAHLGALGGWPTECEVRGPDRAFDCDVSPLKGPEGEIIGTTCVARYELIEVGEVT